MDKKKYDMGWLPDLPSIYDYTKEHKQISPLVEKFNLKNFKKALPSKVDLQKWFSPVKNQGQILSCTAHAGTALMEYYEKRAFGKWLDESRLFLYKTTKNLLKQTGNVGVYPRTTMEAMALFGVPPEEYWPYDKKMVDEEPPAFCYAYADNYKMVNSFRLDTQDCQAENLLKEIKLFLTFGFPSMLGFTVYSSFMDESVTKTGKILYPGKKEQVLGGHAVTVAGYDNSIIITNHKDKSLSTKGALLIKNSMGTDWGGEMKGYGWLPYDYVINGLARDIWVLFKMGWIETDEFGTI